MHAKSVHWRVVKLNNVAIADVVNCYMFRHLSFYANDMARPFAHSSMQASAFLQSTLRGEEISWQRMAGGTLKRSNDSTARKCDWGAMLLLDRLKRQMLYP